MTFGESIQTCFSKYATFSGRATRSEYWYFYLFNFLVGLALNIVGFSLGLVFLSSIYSIAVLIPGLAVFARRMHDIGKSGWNYFWILLPIVGAIMLIVWCCRKSEPGENAYGPAEA